MYGILVRARVDRSARQQNNAPAVESSAIITGFTRAPPADPKLDQASKQAASMSMHHHSDGQAFDLAFLLTPINLIFASRKLT